MFFLISPADISTKASYMEFLKKIFQSSATNEGEITDQFLNVKITFFVLFLYWKSTHWRYFYYHLIVKWEIVKVRFLEVMDNW